jgi:hypothetical protein
MCQLGQRNGQNVHACVDVVGHHLASGCPIGGHRIATHNGVVHALDSVLHYVGLWTKREELHAFDNFETGEERGLRPDITVFNMPGQTGKLCLDVTVTSPLLGTQKGQVSAPTTMAKVMEVGRAANGAFKGKMTKYSTYAANNGFGFAPIVFESTGRMHKKTLDFLRLCSGESAERRRIPRETLFTYFLKRLSVALQLGVASAIVKGLHNLTAHCGDHHDPSYSIEAVVGHDMVR